MVGSYSQTQGTTLRSRHEFPNVKRWLEEIGERPAVKKAVAMGPEVREGSGFDQRREAATLSARI